MIEETDKTESRLRKHVQEPYEHLIPGTRDSTTGMIIRPCPFCGRAKLEIESPDGNHMYVNCRGCLSHGPIEEDLAYCIERWNKVPR